jgi:hypothetical protein
MNATAGTVTGEKPASQVLSPKVGFAALGSAIATLLWILLPILVPSLKAGLSPETQAALTGATATIVAAVIGYVVVDPRRQ